MYRPLYPFEKLNIVFFVSVCPAAVYQFMLSHDFRNKYVVKEIAIWRMIRINCSVTSRS